MEGEVQRSVSFRLNRRGERSNQNPYSKGKEAPKFKFYLFLMFGIWVFVVALFYAI